jgi:divalent metal cation (Fe/Co/Zn/Cd) transporter
MSQCVVCRCADQSCGSCESSACIQRNCYSCCCSESHSLWRQKEIERGLLLQRVSIGWMAVEVVGAIGAAILASSFALLAFGADSVVELLSAFVVMRHLALDRSGSSAQGEKTALFTSLLLISIVPIIGVSSTYAFVVMKLRPEPSPLGIGIALGSVLVMAFLWREKSKIGRETGCLPLSIDAIESATCFFMALALLGGLVAEYYFRLGWIDYAATLIIVGFVAFEARESFAEATGSRNKSL